MNFINKGVYNLLSRFRNTETLTLVNSVAKINDYNLIIPNLYLGNMKCASNLNFLLEHNIQGIVNCTEHEPFHEYFNGKPQLRLYINDSKEKSNIEKFKNTVFSKYNQLILPPFIIHNTKLINNNKYISFLFKDVSDGITSKKIATVKIFQKGKINILGAKNAEHVRLIYNFIRNIIRHNIEQMISIKACAIKGG